MLTFLHVAGGFAQLEVQHREIYRFHDEIVRSSIQSGVYVLRIAIRGGHDHTEARILFMKLLQQGHSICLRHLDVKQDNHDLRMGVQTGYSTSAHS